MTRHFFHLPIVLVFVLALAGSSKQTLGASVCCDDVHETEEQCGEYGTTVTFAKSPTEAAKQALKNEKLVFVLHVSGNFETPDYT